MPHPITVHEKALGHLTRGLYRSPASAIRELVSNAWDANATRVSITTGRPTFERLRVVDNGDGFSRASFERLMSGFGNSDKRSSGLALRFGRPTIGRLGIGLLGIAQVCGSFSIRSKPRVGVGFVARIRLHDRLRSRIDSADPSIVTPSDAGEEDIPSTSSVEVGDYEFVDADWNEGEFGTEIESTDLIPTFVFALQKSYESMLEPPEKHLSKTTRKQPKRRGSLPTTWEGFVRRATKVASVQELGDYWRWLWELSALCPVPYMTATSLPAGLVESHQKRLERYKFAVDIDGFELRKPISLSRNEGGYTTHEIPRTVTKVFKRDLVYSGYIAVQRFRQIRPSDLRGLLVRMRDVGVGLYDASMLDYRFNEGPRSHWLTGEIFVESGLEDSLNVDRDSFNRYSPEFLVLQREVHALLRGTIFPDVYRKMDKRTQARNADRTDARVEAFESVLADALDEGTRVSVKRVDDSTSDSDVASDGATVTIRGNSVRVELLERGLSGASKSNSRLGSAIIALYDIAASERDSANRRDRFVVLLRELLARW